MYQTSEGECPCRVTYMTRSSFITTQNRNIVSISDITAALSEANMQAGEVDAYLAETIPRLMNCSQDVADACTNNAVVLGESSSGSVQDALAFYQQAQSQIESALLALDQAQTSLRGGMQCNTEYIGKLNS